MRDFDSIAAAADAIRRFYFINEDALPDTIKQRVGGYIGQGSSPVDLVVRTVEAVYAHREDAAVTPELKEIAAGAARHAALNGFHDMATNTRGENIAQVLDGVSTEGPPAKAEFGPNAAPGPVSLSPTP